MDNKIINKKVMMGITSLTICGLIGAYGCSEVSKHTLDKNINYEYTETSKININEKYDKFMLLVTKSHNDMVAKELKKQEQIRLNKIKQQKIKAEQIKKYHKKKAHMNRGNMRSGFRVLKEVECYLTFYSNSDTIQEGGRHDKKGRLLVNHEEPICALPSNVPYGHYLILDKRVNGEKIYKNVDTGGAIVWLDDEQTKMKVDIFIEGVTEKWLYNHTNKRVVKGWICKK